MSINGADSLSSESSGQALDSRFMQRRLQRLNTEQGFRDQRQASSQHPIHAHAHAQLPQHQLQHQQHQQQPPQTSSVQHPYLADQPLAARIPQTNIVAASAATSATTPSSASPQFRHDTPQPPQYQPLRNFAKLHDDGPAHPSTSPSKLPRQPPMAASNQPSIPTPTVVPNVSALSQQQSSQHASLQSKDTGRSTPQPQPDELSEDQIRQLLTDHKELRKPPWHPSHVFFPC